MTPLVHSLISVNTPASYSIRCFSPCEYDVNMNVPYLHDGHVQGNFFLIVSFPGRCLFLPTHMLCSKGRMVDGSIAVQGHDF